MTLDEEFFCFLLPEDELTRWGRAKLGGSVTT